METRQNLLLDTMSAPDQDRLRRHMKPVVLERGSTLCTPARRMLHAYFPLDALISVVGITEQGHIVDAGLIGREGFLGLPIILGDAVSSHHAIVQITGEALRIQAPLLKAAFDWSGTLRDSLLKYVQYYITQIGQTAVCNRSHTLEARLARWLMMAQDGAGTETLHLTQEYLSQMLGAQRPGVTMAASELKQAGIIRYSRGKIVIDDRARLRQIACDCYNTVVSERNRLLTGASSRQQILARSAL